MGERCFHNGSGRRNLYIHQFHIHNEYQVEIVHNATLGWYEIDSSTWIGKDTITLTLVKNPDIIKYVAFHKEKQVVVGFALESKNLLSYAKTKLKEKSK